MPSYPWLNGLVLLLVVILVWRFGSASISWRQLGMVAFTMCLLTLVFDNLIIAAGIVEYRESTLLGLRLGLAPIEDFAYAIAAAVGLPVLWERLHVHTR